jgi:2-oxoglutarate ferredoxin oxidoreductase subunit beta
MSDLISPTKLTKKDFETDQDLRWCPGCGDYSILANVQRVMPEFGIARENIVWVSGIGCSSRGLDFRSARAESAHRTGLA